MNVRLVYGLLVLSVSEVLAIDKEDEASSHAYSQSNSLARCPMVTSSEERRIDEDGTFHSLGLRDKTSKVASVDASGSSSTSGQTSSSSSEAAEKKQCSLNTDPKSNSKRKGKADAKKKKFLKKSINNFNGMNLRVNKDVNIAAEIMDIKHAEQRCAHGKHAKDQQMKGDNTNINQIKKSIREKSQMNQKKTQENQSIYKKFMETSNLKRKNEEHHNEVKHHSRLRMRQSKLGYQGDRPHL